MLDKKFKNVIISTNTLKMEKVAKKIDAFLENHDIYSQIEESQAAKLKSLLDQFFHYMEKGYKNKAQYDFDEIFEIMQEIAPEDCTFGYGEYNGTDLGFWEFQ